MSEEVSKEVELKVYLAGLEDVPAFIDSIELSKFFYRLEEAKNEVIVEPTLENFQEYVKASKLFMAINGNILSLLEAYLSVLPPTVEDVEED